MHGILRNHGTQRREDTDIAVRQVVLRYDDGHTVTFVPDAEREFFNHDDMLELVRVFEKASAAAEWGEINERAEQR